MENEFSWQTTEYVYQKKSADWYWALGIISLSFAAAAYVFHNALLGILILIGGFTIALYGSRPPKPLSCSLTRRGVHINELLYPYATLKSFWINELSNPPVLLFKSKKVFVPYISLRLPENVDIEKLREELGAVLAEEELTESPVFTISERLGF